MKGRKMMKLAEVRLHGPHGLFQKSESKKWPNTISTARCVLLEVHVACAYHACPSLMGRLAFPVDRRRFRGVDRGDEVARAGQEDDESGRGPSSWATRLIPEERVEEVAEHDLPREVCASRSSPRELRHGV